jgi:hypothetical protein
MASTNITTFPGKVGISNANPTHTLSIGSNVFVDDTGLMVTGTITTTGELSGDGAGLSNIQTSNVIGLTNNVARIGTLETDLESNVTRIETLETDLGSNVTRIETLETDLGSNVTRIGNLESGDITITGTKTFQDDVVLESNLRVQGDLLVANTVNMTVSDPILELGSNNLNTGDVGIVMTRHGASNSNVAMFYDESSDILKLGYTLNGANDTTLEFDSNALAVSVQGALTVGSNLEVGTANLFVDTATGNVGIGTTSPGYQLDIHNSSKATMRLKSNASSGDGDAILYIDSSQTGESDIDFMHDGALNWRLRTGDAAGTNFQIHDDDDTARFVIKQDGNVGIGVTNPGVKLDLPDASSYNPVIRIGTNTTYSDDQLYTLRWGGSGLMGMGLYSSTRTVFGSQGIALHIPATEEYSVRTNGWAKLFALDGATYKAYFGGNVGIGTTSPIARLDINGGAENNTTPALAIRGGLLTESDLYVLNTYSTNTGVGYAAKVIGVNIKNKVETDNTVKIRSNTGGVTSAGAIYLGSDDVNQGIFGVLGGTGAADTTLSEFLTVRASGNVGIGTTSPGGKLDIYTGSTAVVGLSLDRYSSGNYRTDIYQNSYGPDFRVGYDTYGPESILYLKRLSNGTKEVEINGNVGIGTTIPRASLDVYGSTFKYGYEFRYQDGWTSNNNQTFTIPVTGGSARGEMIVEAEVIQVAANSSSERLARIKGIITNYHTGNSYIKLFEGTNVEAFETYVVGTSALASGTFTLKYRPLEGYLQSVVCRLNLKIFIGGYTSYLGSLSRTDNGSNSALTAPTFDTAPHSFGGNVGIGNTNPGFPLTIGTTDGNKILFNQSGTTPGHNITCSSGWQWNFNAARSGQDDDAKITFNISGSSGYDEMMRINHTGVGIGTVSPSHKLTVAAASGDAEVHIQAQGNGSTGAIIYFNGSATNQRKCAIISSPINSWCRQDLHFCHNTSLNYDDVTVADSKMVITNAGNVGIGTTSPGTKLDVNGGIRTRLPHMWARQTVQPANTTSLLLVWNNTVYNDTTLGNMYSTTRTCNFPIKGVYVVTVQAHSYYAGGAVYYTDLRWVQKNSSGGTRWTTYNNPRQLSENSGNSDMHLTGTMVIVADAGDYLEVTHSTSLTTYRNYNGGWNNIRAACIYQVN